MNIVSKNYLKIIITIIALIIISFCVFIFFKAFFKVVSSDYASEILAGFLGAIITIIITWILLQAQSASEENKEKSLGIFQAKLKIYSDFLEYLNKVISDKKIDEEEVKCLKEWALKISLISTSNTTECFVSFIKQAILFKKFRYEDLTDAQKKKWTDFYKKEYNVKKIEEGEGFVTVGDIVSTLRKDLGETKLAEEKKSLSTLVYIEELI